MNCVKSYHREIKPSPLHHVGNNYKFEIKDVSRKTLYNFSQHYKQELNNLKALSMNHLRLLIYDHGK